VRVPTEWADAGVRDVRAIGDADAPGLIAHAVYAGHRAARELDAPADADAVPFRRHLHATTT
jgi:dimethylamine/trimethylamine dehydrogenase